MRIKFFLVALGLWGCGSSNLSESSGSGSTTTNCLSLNVSDPWKQKPNFLRVSVIRSDFSNLVKTQTSFSLDTLINNSSKIFINTIPRGQFNLLIENEQELSVLIPIQFNSESDTLKLDSILLRPKGILLIKQDEIPLALIGLKDFPRKSERDSGFYFKVPLGQYQLSALFQHTVQTLAPVRVHSLQQTEIRDIQWSQGFFSTNSTEGFLLDSLKITQFASFYPEMKKLPLSSRWIVRQNRIEELDLSSLNLLELHSFIQEIRFLKVLNLSSNRFHHLPPEILGFSQTRFEVLNNNLCQLSEPYQTFLNTYSLQKDWLQQQVGCSSP